MSAPYAAMKLPRADTASAPAKIILFGEHAVVYGQPALAVPVSQLRVTATITPGLPGQGLRLIASDLNQELPVPVDQAVVDNVLIQMAQSVLTWLNCPAPDAHIMIESAIPLASGLGSGAAVSAALGRAVARAAGQTIPDAVLNRLVYAVEQVHHGTPSGVDNTVIVYERPVYFVRDVQMDTLTFARPIHLLIGDTGLTALTRDSVGDVRRLYDSSREPTTELLNRIGDLTRNARQALETGDLNLVGELANANHDLLQQLTVSCAELDTLIEAARAAGAVGAKLSGGGRGGNMIAFVTPATRDAVQQALFAAGAVRVFATTVETVPSTPDADQPNSPTS